MIGLVRKVINKHDPLGLLEMGAPEDEYSPEINSISKRLTTQMSKQEIEKVVFEEFDYWFGVEITKSKSPALKEIAKDIFKLIGEAK